MCKPDGERCQNNCCDLPSQLAGPLLEEIRERVLLERKWDGTQCLQPWARHQENCVPLLALHWGQVLSHMQNGAMTPIPLLQSKQSVSVIIAVGATAFPLSLTLESRKLSFNSLLCYLLPVWTWRSHVAPPCLCFLSPGEIPATTLSCSALQGAWK